MERSRHKNFLLLLILSMVLFGCKKPIIDPETRKEQSISILEEYGIPYIRKLPAIASEQDLRMRGKEEVCERAICLAMVASWANGMSKEVLEREIVEYGVRGKFTPEEDSFLFAETRDAKKARECIWRYEALNALLWSLSYVDTLDIPKETCDTKKVLNIVSKTTREKFIRGAKLRTKAEILDQADLAYRLHWATLEAFLNGEPMPGDLKYDVVYERHYALNWLIRFQDQEWDSVGTDT